MGKRSLEISIDQPSEVVADLCRKACKQIKWDEERPPIVTSDGSGGPVVRLAFVRWKNPFSMTHGKDIHVSVSICDMGATYSKVTLVGSVSLAYGPIVARQLDDILKKWQGEILQAARSVTLAAKRQESKSLPSSEITWELCEIRIAERSGAFGVGLICILEAVALGPYGQRTIDKSEFKASSYWGEWARDRHVLENTNNLVAKLAADGWEPTGSVIHPQYGVSLPRFRRQYVG